MCLLSKPKTKLAAKLKEVTFRLAKKWFQTEAAIQQLENGFLVGGKYYPTIDDAMLDFTKYLKEFFNEK